MSPLDFAGITLLIFLCSLLIIYRVKQELDKHFKKIDKEIAEIKLMLKKRESDSD